MINALLLFVTGFVSNKKNVEYNQINPLRFRRKRSLKNEDSHAEHTFQYTFLHIKISSRDYQLIPSVHLFLVHP